MTTHIGDGGGRRREILDLLRAAGAAMPAREIADEIGLHINTVRFHLDVLERQGAVARRDHPAAGPGRPPVRYAPAQGPTAGGERNYRLLSEMLLAHLAGDDDPHEAAVAAGAQWGRYLVRAPAPGQRLTPAEGLRRLVDLLSDIGFDPAVVPEVTGTPNPDPPEPRQRPEPPQPRAPLAERTAATSGDVQVALRHCPFYELAATHRQLVCTLHFGLMAGALEALDVPVTPVELVPYARPDACLAAFRTAGAAPKGPPS